MASDRGVSNGRSFFGHPRGLAYIAFTEVWERFSFYGMQALLILYMTGHLFKQGAVERVAGFAAFRSGLESIFGHLTDQGLASQIFGLYVGLVYFLPVLGGIVGDRITGRKPAVLSGAALMTAGHYMMAFDMLFLTALSLITLGSGLLKGNLAAQVGELYEQNDRRRDRAFTIYATAVNLGAFIAPVVCGTLGEVYGWHYGFIAAGSGMLVSIAIYLAGARYLPPERRPLRVHESLTLSAQDRRRAAALLVILSMTSLYWIAEAQVWNVYPLWQRDHVGRVFFGFTIPVTWFQSLDSLTALAFAPLVLILWKSQADRGKEPGDLPKIALGLALCAASFLLLSVGQAVADGTQVRLIWPVSFHIVAAFGYLYSVPIALAVVCRAAPPAINAMLVGVFYLAIFVGGVISGWLGRYYHLLSPSSFWAVHAAVAFLGAVLIFMLRSPLARELNLSATPGGA